MGALGIMGVTAALQTTPRQKFNINKKMVKLNFADKQINKTVNK